MPISINRSTTKISNPVDIGISYNTERAVLIGYVGYSGAFDDASVTATTVTTPVYILGGTLGQYPFGVRPYLWANPEATVPYNPGGSGRYAFAPALGQTPYYYTQITNGVASGQRGFVFAQGKYIGTWRYAFCPTTVSNIDSLFVGPLDTIPYPGMNAYETNAGSFFGVDDMIAYCTNVNGGYATHMVNVDGQFVTNVTII